MIRNIFSEIYNLLTSDNSHEEDNDTFEYAFEPATHFCLGWAASASAIAVLLMLLFR